MPKIKNVSARLVNGRAPGESFEVDAATYARHRKAHSWGRLFADAGASMPAAGPLPENLTLPSSEKDAMKAIENANDLDTLMRWARTEKRPKVLEAIEKRGEKISRDGE